MLQVGAEVQKVQGRRGATEFRQLGQLLDQRCLGDPTVFLWRRPERLRSRPAGDGGREAGRSVDGPEGAGEGHYTAAIKRITEQAYWLSMFTYVTQYTFAKNLKFTPFPDELPRFYLCEWT